MYNEKIEALIAAALADGVLTEKEKQILFKNAQAQGIDLDEFEMVLDARLVELQKSTNSAPKSDKYGHVRKCPSCGAIVGAFKGTCPECGFEFTEIDANLSSRKLYEALAKENDIRRKQEIIETFPLPNAKADLLEFLTALKPRIYDQKSEFADAYYKKYAECIEKAKVSFAEDKQLKPFIDDFCTFEKELKKKKEIIERDLKKKKIIALLQKNKKLTAIISIVVIVIIFSVISSVSSSIENAKAKQNAELFDKYIEDKDVENAKLTLQKFKTVQYDKALELISLYIENNDVDNAIYVYEKLTPDHCSTYNMQWKNLYGHGLNGDYEQKATSLIYKALISSEQMEEAWKYHKWEYDDSDYRGNAKDYFSYLNDVVYHYCKNNNKNVARTFVKEHIVWFENNIDPDESKEYIEYKSSRVKEKLFKVIDNY